MFMTLNEENSQNFKKKKHKSTDISDNSKIKMGQIDPEQYMRVLNLIMTSQTPVRDISNYNFY